MKIYIIGPMTGMPAYNVLAFAEAAQLFSKYGYDPHTPFEANAAVWLKHHGRAFDPFVDTCDYGDPLLKEMVAADIALLLTCEGVALLPGWEQSRGSGVEVHLATNMRMPTFDAETGMYREVEVNTHLNWLGEF